jgi:hypothetical protein
MQKIRMAVLMAIVLGIGFIPTAAHAGDSYGKSREDRWLVPQTAPCAPGRYDGYARYEHQTIHQPYKVDVYAGTPHHSPCEKPATKLALKAKKVKSLCGDPCRTDLQSVKTELQRVENKLDEKDSELQKTKGKLEAARERERADSIKIQELERRLGTAQERDRVYREWYYTGWLPWKNR